MQLIYVVQHLAYALGICQTILPNYIYYMFWKPKFISFCPSWGVQVICT